MAAARPAPRSRRRLSISRKLLFGGAIALLVAALLEAGLHLTARYVRPDLGLAGTFKAQSAAAAGAITVTERQEMPEVIHPYVGFVLDPTEGPAVNQYGFLQIDGPVLQRGPSSLIVGITGGSVAQIWRNSAAPYSGSVWRPRFRDGGCGSSVSPNRVSNSPSRR